MLRSICCADRKGPARERGPSEGCHVSDLRFRVCLESCASACSGAFGAWRQPLAHVKPYGFITNRVRVINHQPSRCFGGFSPLPCLALRVCALPYPLLQSRTTSTGSTTYYLRTVHSTLHPTPPTLLRTHVTVLYFTAGKAAFKCTFNRALYAVYAICRLPYFVRVIFAEMCTSTLFSGTQEIGTVHGFVCTEPHGQCVCFRK